MKNNGSDFERVVLTSLLHVNATISGLVCGLVAGLLILSSREGRWWARIWGCWASFSSAIR